MPRLPRITGRQCLRALRRGGWEIVRTRGSHQQLNHLEKPGRRVTVPLHAGRTLSPRVLNTILKQADMTADEFRALL